MFMRASVILDIELQSGGATKYCRQEGILVLYLKYEMELIEIIRNLLHFISPILDGKEFASTESWIQRLT